MTDVLSEDTKAESFVESWTAKSLLGEVTGSVFVGLTAIDPWFRCVGLPGLLTLREGKKDGAAQSEL